MNTYMVRMRVESFEDAAKYLQDKDLWQYVENPEEDILVCNRMGPNVFDAYLKADKDLQPILRETHRGFWTQDPME